MNVAELLRDRPGVALRAGRRSITFRELRERVARTAAALHARGVRPGDAVVVLVPMSIELYVAMLGALWAGAVGVFLDPWLGAKRAVEIAQPAAILGTRRSLCARWLVPALRRIPVVQRVGGRLPPAGTAPPAPRGADDPALITFTGGSSGEPKPTSRSHGALLAQHDALMQAFPVEADDVDVSTLPIFVLRNLAAGIVSCLPEIDLRRIDRFDARRMAQRLRDLGVTTCTASPPFLDRLATAGELKLRRVLTGGAPVGDAQLLRWLPAFRGAEIQVLYGSTEAEPVAHIEARERLRARGLGTCLGRPVPQVSVRIDEQPGEFLVSGPHVNAAGWHPMGDVGYRDAQGRLWQVGRVHAKIERARRTVFAHLIEEAARGRDGAVRRVAAVGMPDPLLGERIVVFVEGDVPADVVRRRIHEAGLPVDELRIGARALPVDPRHRSKIDYAKLRATG